MATYTVELDRKGPGLLYRDIIGGKDAQVRAIIKQITATKPDILALQRFDWDLKNRAAHGFQTLLAAADWPMPHAFAPRPNSGMQSNVDINQDGKLGRASDAQGYGRFAGQRGMLLLSRYPIDTTMITDYSDLIWADIPATRSNDAGPVAQVQRLSSVAHIRVPVKVNRTVLQILMFHATPPVFDGPDDRNGRRNADEITFWLDKLDGMSKPFVILANANLDPIDGEGIKESIQSLLSHKTIQDPQPTSKGATQNADPSHKGDPALDTVDWDGPNPGNLRVSYALPSADLDVSGAGVAWQIDQPNTASRHRIIWVDITLP